MPRIRPYSRLAIGVGLGGLLAATAAVELHAQQPPPAWKQGQPTSMADSKLAPHATPLTVTPLEKIAVDKLKVPNGFKVEVWAHGMPGARMMARGDKGTIFIGTRVIGKVYAVTDKDGKRTHRVIAEGLKQPNGVAFKDGKLYVISIDQALRFDGIEDKLDAPQPTDISEAIKLPPSTHHNWKFAAVGPDNKLYISIGSPCNICEINTGMYGLIRRQNLDGSNIEIVARGVRNSVGFDWHPQTKELWFTDNGRDWAGDAGPEEELNRVAANNVGGFFGFPYCHANGVPDPDIKKPNPCAGVTLPAATLGPHAAALGIRFYTGSMFPAAYKNTAFIARRGSWNRTKKFGYDVVQAKIKGGKATITPFLTGFLDQQSDTFWGRPVDVLVMPDGALLVSDEQNGAVYRISYGGKVASAR
ncbi:MAG TPA: PQQ-dependent sugar dehydrogenase [Hyphomicrobiaceae bacterium]|nr:PQQ-dependent sugar dehydrogenase [Hyphomicrobiaceae bacterium]